MPYLISVSQKLNKFNFINAHKYTQTLTHTYKHTNIYTHRCINLHKYIVTDSKKHTHTITRTITRTNLHKTQTYIDAQKHTNTRSQHGQHCIHTTPRPIHKLYANEYTRNLLRNVAIKRLLQKAVTF